jgi:hypothetical protein
VSHKSAAARFRSQFELLKASTIRARLQRGKAISRLPTQTVDREMGRWYVLTVVLPYIGPKEGQAASLLPKEGRTLVPARTPKASKIARFRGRWLAGNGRR